MISKDSGWELSGDNSYIYNDIHTLGPAIQFFINDASTNTNAQLAQYYSDKWNFIKIIDSCPFGSSINVDVESSEYLQRVIMRSEYEVKVRILDSTSICWENKYTDLVSSINYAGYIDMEKPVVSSSELPALSKLYYVILTYGQEPETGTFSIDCPQYPMRMTFTNNIDYGTSLYGGFVREVISSGATIPTYVFNMAHELYFYISPEESFSSTMTVSNSTIKLLRANGTEITKYVYPMSFELLTPEEQDALCSTNKIYTF